MKRYWLFGFSNWYPKGGMEDFIGAFDSVDLAIGIGRAEEDECPDACWWHVFDSHEHRVVAHGEGTSCEGLNEFEELDKVREET